MGKKDIPKGITHHKVEFSKFDAFRYRGLECIVNRLNDTGYFTVEVSYEDEPWLFVSMIRTVLPGQSYKHMFQPLGDAGHPTHLHAAVAVIDSAVANYATAAGKLQNWLD